MEENGTRGRTTVLRWPGGSWMRSCCCRLANLRCIDADFSNGKLSPRSTQYIPFLSFLSLLNHRTAPARGDALQQCWMEKAETSHTRSTAEKCIPVRLTAWVAGRLPQEKFAKMLPWEHACFGCKLPFVPRPDRRLLNRENTTNRTVKKMPATHKIQFYRSQSSKILNVYVEHL